METRVLAYQDQLLLAGEGEVQSGSAKVLFDKVRLENLGPSHAVITHIGFSDDARLRGLFTPHYQVIAQGDSAEVLAPGSFRAWGDWQDACGDRTRLSAIEQAETRHLWVQVITPHGQIDLRWRFEGNPHQEPVRLLDAPLPPTELPGPRGL